MGKNSHPKIIFSVFQKLPFIQPDPDMAMLLTEKPGSFNTDIVSLQAGGESGKKFGVADLNGKQLTYTLLGFNAKADPGKSLVGRQRHSPIYYT